MGVSELGKTATKVKESLKQVLKLSSKWNTILLLDKYNIFLKAQSTANIWCNYLISGESNATFFSFKVFLSNQG